MSDFTLDKLPRKVLAQIDLQTAFMAARCVIAAERLQLFRKLSGKEMTAATIGKKTGIAGWRLEIYLAALVSLGLLKKKGMKYRNSALAEKYFVKERSIFWTTQYSKENVEDYKAFSVLEEMLTTGRGYQSILGLERKDYIARMHEDPQWAHDFTHMLYYHHQPEARALANSLDLRGFQRVLDVGGGSGVMSMALARKYKHLKATVLDIEPVIRVTQKIIRREKLSARIDTCLGDMNEHLPDGYDVIMFCDTSHYSPELLKRTYDSLPDRGMVVHVDSFFSENWSGALYRLMWQLRSTDLWLEKRRQIVDRLRQVGFKAATSRRIYDDIWMITGRK